MDSPEPERSSSSPSVNLRIHSLKIGAQKDWLVVKLSDGASFFCRLDWCESLGLEAEGSLDPDQFEALQAQDSLYQCGVKARQLAASREESSWTLTQKLLKRGWSRDQVGQILPRLIEEGFIDDRRYGEAWIREKERLRPSSREKILAQLREKGLPRDLAQELLQNWDNGRELEKAVERLQMKGISDKQTMRKKLLRSGFHLSAIERSLAQLI